MGAHALTINDWRFLSGALSEMKVATYYTSLGHAVFWPSIRISPVDLIVEKNDGLARVQVKTATWIKSGTYSYLEARIRSSNKAVHAQSGHYDTIMVCYEEELWEIPAKLVFSSNICLRGTRPGRKEEAWDNYKVR